MNNRRKCERKKFSLLNRLFLRKILTNLVLQRLFSCFPLLSSHYPVNVVAPFFFLFFFLFLFLFFFLFIFFFLSFSFFFLRSFPTFLSFLLSFILPTFLERILPFLSFYLLLPAFFPSFFIQFCFPFIRSSGGVFGSSGLGTPSSTPTFSFSKSPAASGRSTPAFGQPTDPEALQALKVKDFNAISRLVVVAGMVELYLQNGSRCNWHFCFRFRLKVMSLRRRNPMLN